MNANITKTKNISASQVDDIVTTIPANGRFFRVILADGKHKSIQATKAITSLDFPVKSIVFGNTEFVVC